MTDEAPKKKMKYERPVLEELAPPRSAQGACTGGSADVTCAPGSATPGGCTPGSVAAPGPCVGGSAPA